MHLFRKISRMVIPSMSTSICYTNFSHTFRVFSPSCFCKSFVSSFFFSINLFFSYNRYASESVKQIGLVESVHLILAMRFIYSYLLRKSLICFAEGFSSRNHCAIERKQCFFFCVCQSSIGLHQKRTIQNSELCVCILTVGIVVAFTLFTSSSTLFCADSRSTDVMYFCVCLCACVENIL